MRKASACHLKVLPSTRSRSLARKKAPPTRKRGQGEGHARVAVWVESPSPPHASPNRVCGIGSMVCSVAHTDCSVPKKMPGPYFAAGPAKSGDHSSPKGTAPGRPPHFGATTKSADPGQGQLENGTVTIKSRAVRANPHNLLRLLRRLAKPAAVPERSVARDL